VVHVTDISDFHSCSISQIRAHIVLVAVSTSREGGTLVLYDLLKYIVQDGLRVVGVAYLRAHAQDVAALLDVVLHVLVCALVRQLRHLYFLARELLVQVVQVQTGGRQLLQRRREDRRLQRWHRRLELWRNQRQRLVLHADRLVELQRVGDQISVVLVQLLVEERGEVFGQLVGLLQAGAQAVGEGGDVGHVVVLAELGLVLDALLEVALVVEQPPKEGLLDLLVVLLLEELVVEELNRAHDHELALAGTHVEGGDGAVGGEADGPTGEERTAGLADVDGGSVGVDELEAAVLVAVGQLVLGVAVLLGVLARLVLLLAVFLSLGGLDQLVVETAVADEGLLGVQILVEGLANDRVAVDADPHLLQHCIDVRVELMLATLRHYNQTSTSLFDVAPDILQLLGIEWQTGTTKQ